MLTLDRCLCLKAVQVHPRLQARPPIFGSCAEASPPPQMNEGESDLPGLHLEQHRLHLHGSNGNDRSRLLQAKSRTSTFPPLTPNASCRTPLARCFRTSRQLLTPPLTRFRVGGRYSHAPSTSALSLPTTIERREILAHHRPGLHISLLPRRCRSHRPSSPSQAWFPEPASGGQAEPCAVWAPVVWHCGLPGRDQPTFEARQPKEVPARRSYGSLHPAGSTFQ